jgi:hypothetical protein
MRKIGARREKKQASSNTLGNCQNRPAYRLVRNIWDLAMAEQQEYQEEYQQEGPPPTTEQELEWYKTQALPTAMLDLHANHK